MRIKDDPVANENWSRTRADVDSIPEIILMGLPEATTVSIVETYWQLKNRKNMSEQKAIEAIESYRSKSTGRGTMPSPLSLTSYIKYRLNFEHSQGAPIRGAFVDAAIEIAGRVFTPSEK